MKKSQLRNIIRESIREMMTEQWSLPNCVGRQVAALKCGTNGSGPGGSFIGGYNYGHPPSCMTIDGQTPQPGDLFIIKSTTPSFDCDTGVASNGWSYGSNALVGNTYEVTYTFPCYESALSQPSNEYFDFESVTCCGIEGCTNPQATNYNPSAICDDGSCLLPVIPVLTIDDPTLSEIECHTCKNGYPISNLFPDPPGCPPGWSTMPPFNPSSCKQPPPIEPRG